MIDKFSSVINEFLNEEFGIVDLGVINSMSRDELITLKQQIERLRADYSRLEIACKLSGNAAYGASANASFYFYNTNLAASITAECRALTEFMWMRLEQFFHEDLWERKDLWEKFNFGLDFTKKEWYKDQPVAIYSDTDSVYITYGTLFKCFDDKSLRIYDTDKKKMEWILQFNKQYLDKQNSEWIRNMYNQRNAISVHNFELETISRSNINLTKKKYLKALAYNKGKWYDNYKISGVGVELIKSTTPKLCHEILIDLVSCLLYEFSYSDKRNFTLYFKNKMDNWRRKFFSSPIEDISESISIGAYWKYVEDDKDELIFKPKCPKSVKAAARYNHLAYKAGQDNLRLTGGKMKYYNIRVYHEGKMTVDYFGFPSGEWPSTFAPKCDLITQWDKTVVIPINRFLSVLGIQEMSPHGIMELNMFD